MKDLTLREFIKPFFLCTTIEIENDDHNKVLYKGNMEGIPEKYLNMRCEDAFVDGHLYIAVKKQETIKCQMQKFASHFHYLEFQELCSLP